MKRWQLKQRQSLPLEVKEKLTNHRIREFYKYMNGNVYISFSGGKDSTVLLNLIRKQFPHVPAVYVDTGLEYPEIRNFVKTINNVVWLKPQMNFRDVITNYGYPVISKENAQKRMAGRAQKNISPVIFYFLAKLQIEFTKYFPRQH